MAILQSKAKVEMASDIGMSFKTYGFNQLCAKINLQLKESFKFTSAIYADCAWNLAIVLLCVCAIVDWTKGKCGIQRRI